VIALSLAAAAPARPRAADHAVDLVARPATQRERAVAAGAVHGQKVELGGGSAGHVFFVACCAASLCESLARNTSHEVAR
jgi:hypothetical protein